MRYALFIHCRKRFANSEFQTQKAMKINSHDPPRTPHLMAMIKDYNNRRRRENELNAFIDRGLDTEAQFGTFREFQRTIETLLTTDTFIAHRTRMDLLISQYMLLRSEDRRMQIFVIWSQLNL